MKNKTFKLTLSLAAALLALPAFAQGPGDGPGFGPHRPPMERAMGPHGDFGRWWNNPRLSEKYKLTEAQRKAMDDIYQQHRLTLVDLHANLEKAELGMEPMIGADQPDETRILAQIDKIAQARAELEKANARMLLGIRKQLTPEQWKQIREDRAQHRMGPDGHDGPGERGDHRQFRRLDPPKGAPGPDNQGNPPQPPPPSGTGEEE
ncbi:MAG TPA: Spy/CpxP family protein refolding chaperone [Acidobacteriaceae bacterium]